MLSNVLNELKRNGHLVTWVNLNRLIAEKTFPFKNIAFLLYIDVCRFFTCHNTSELRYREKVKRFWRIGYRLFHGKWLKFMSGPKHLGAILDKNDKGMFSPDNANINFAVPMSSIKSTELAPVKPSEISPGLLPYMSGNVSENSKPTKAYTVCFDGV